MCGIAGFVTPAADIEPSGVLSEMVRVIAHTKNPLGAAEKRERPCFVLVLGIDCSVIGC